MTTLERWLKRFHNGAGKAYTWRLTWHLTGAGRRRLLRAVLPEGGVLPVAACPLTMQEHFDGFPSMLGTDLLRIIAVADDAPDADPVLRQSVLRSCGIDDIC
jgi:hypothetical protein